MTAALPTMFQDRPRSTNAANVILTKPLKGCHGLEELGYEARQAVRDEQGQGGAGAQSSGSLTILAFAGSSGQADNLISSELYFHRCKAGKA